MNATAQSSTGNHLKLFRFDVLQIPSPQGKLETLLLTLETDQKDRFAWGLTKALGEDLLTSFRDLHSELGHKLNPSAPDVIEFLSSRKIDILSGYFKDPKGDQLRTVGVHGSPDAYLLEATTSGGSTRVLTIAPSLTCVFTMHLSDALSAMA